MLVLWTSSALHGVCVCEKLTFSEACLCCRNCVRRCAPWCVRLSATCTPWSRRETRWFWWRGPSPPSWTSTLVSLWFTSCSAGAMLIVYNLQTHFEYICDVILSQSLSLINNVLGHRCWWSFWKMSQEWMELCTKERETQTGLNTCACMHAHACALCLCLCFSLCLCLCLSVCLSLSLSLSHVCA